MTDPLEWGGSFVSKGDWLFGSFSVLPAQNPLQFAMAKG